VTVGAIRLGNYCVWLGGPVRAVGGECIGQERRIEADMTEGSPFEVDDLHAIWGDQYVAGIQVCVHQRGERPRRGEAVVDQRDVAGRDARVGKSQFCSGGHHITPAVHSRPGQPVAGVLIG
jgi:hypothetical protein